MRTPEQIEELLDKLEGMLNAYSDADAKYLDDQDKANWSDKYGERLGKYSDKLKVLNGDDFDILEESRKEHKDSYSDLSDDDYVNSLEENIKKVLARVWPEATEEQVETVASETAEGVASGETEAEVEEETAAETAPEETEVKTEEPAAETAAETAPEETAPEEDPVQSEYEELLKYKENMPKRKE